MRQHPKLDTIVARLTAGDISQQALARELGVPQATISRIWQRHLDAQTPQPLNNEQVLLPTRR